VHRAAHDLLLTGAGFTRDFGGLLAKEIWNDLYNHERVREVADLASQLCHYEGDFETAFHDLALKQPRSETARALNAALLDTFKRLDEGVRNAPCRSGTPDLHELRGFIRRFVPTRESEAGYLFTLNQDLFPERYLVGQGDAGSPVLPGFPCSPGRCGGYLVGGDGAKLQEGDTRTAPTKEDIDKDGARWIQGGQLHCVKLHGSQNWRRSDSTALMVVGGEKTRQIAGEPILEWYLKLFQKAICDGRQHRLFVIGYSFRDLHVNRVLDTAARDNRLDLVVIDPEPRGQLGQRLEDHGFRAINEALDRTGSRYFRCTVGDLFRRDPYAGRSRWLKDVLRLFRS